MFQFASRIGRADAETNGNIVVNPFLLSLDGLQQCGILG